MKERDVLNMNKKKLFFISVFLPTLLFCVAWLNTNYFGKFINSYLIALQVVVSIASYFLYLHRFRKYHIETKENTKKITFMNRFDLNSILYGPLFLVVLLSSSFYFVNSLIESATDPQTKTLSNFGKDIDKDKSIGKGEIPPSNTLAELDSNPQEYPVFTPILNSDESIKDQFLKHATKVFKEKTSNNSYSAEEAEKKRPMMMTIHSLFKQGEWEELLQYVDHNLVDELHIYSELINLGPFFKMPIDVMIELSNRGGEATPHTLLQMINQERYDDVLVLQNLGSDLSRGFYDSNILQIAFFTPMTPKAFDFIVSNTEIINSVGALGVDTLGSAIVNAETNPEHIEQYINVLIDKGSTINKQHIVLMKGLKKDSPELYLKIVKFIPELQL